MSNSVAPARRRARRAALQAIYQWQMSQNSVTEIEKQFREEYKTSKADMDYFATLLLGVAKGLSEVDEALSAGISRGKDEISPVELATLRLAVYELLHCPEVPYRVVINEAVDLAKRFGADKAHKFVNGVLDNLAKHLRSVEVAAAAKSNK
ncbi:MAG: transcription antitermination factor NusB [Gammaproteobacteria bacterium]|nr:transcription antitermination factor NusB [Gammaproteobacteria bacterium]